MIEDLFGVIGLKPIVRNFLVEYHDKEKQSWHKPVQTIVMSSVPDEEIIRNIIKEQKEQGNDVYGIIEFYGKYTISELKIAIEDPDTSKYSVRPLFIDREKVLI